MKLHFTATAGLVAAKGILYCWLVAAKASYTALRGSGKLQESWILFTFQWFPGGFGVVMVVVYVTIFVVFRGFFCHNTVPSSCLSKLNQRMKWWIC